MFWTRSYLLFPLQMGLQRALGFTVAHPEAATRFYGSEEWKALWARRTTPAQSKRFRREMELLYASRLQALGWDHVRRQRRVADRGERILYYMLFATNHPVAKALADWEMVADGDERRRGQTTLFDADG